MTDRISSRADVMGGKPCISGTRVTVEHVLRELAAGATAADLEADYGLSREDVAAVLDFAADSVDKERVYPIASGQ